MERKINYLNTAVAETKALVEAGPLHVKHIVASNAHTAATFLQIFDAVSTASVTLGTTAAKMSVAIPAGGSVVIDKPELSVAKGLVVAVTAGAANGTAPGAAGVVNIALEQA